MRVGDQHCWRSFIIIARDALKQFSSFIEQSEGELDPGTDQKTDRSAMPIRTLTAELLKTVSFVRLFTLMINENVCIERKERKILYL